MQEAIELSSVLDLLAADALKDQIMTALDSSGDVILDASEVTRITTPCIQILIASSKDLRSSDREIVLEKSSEIFDSAMRDLGFGDFLESWRK